MFNELYNELNALKAAGYNYEVLFLEASDEVLVKRYKETRRMHPLARMGGSLTESKETQLFSTLSVKGQSRD